MRTVRDARGITWICLEIPRVPSEQEKEAAMHRVPMVAMECNAGAERVIALVAPGCDDHRTSPTLNSHRPSRRPSRSMRAQQRQQQISTLCLTSSR